MVGRLPGKRWWSAMPSLPWKGFFIRVDSAGEVAWMRCAHCHRPLEVPDSRVRGIGPDCLLKYDDQAHELARQEALDADRARWRKQARDERWTEQARARDRAAGRILRAAERERYPPRDPNWVPPWRRLRRAQNGS